MAMERYRQQRCGTLLTMLMALEREREKIAHTHIIMYILYI